jgi:hypothetical protein
MYRILKWMTTIKFGSCPKMLISSEKALMVMEGPTPGLWANLTLT